MHLQPGALLPGLAKQAHRLEELLLRDHLLFEVRSDPEYRVNGVSPFLPDLRIQLPDAKHATQVRSDEEA